MIKFQLPPPANWQDFESLCLSLWSDIWGDPNAQKQGRQGQPQHGVDVFGRDGGIGGWHGVQCKLKEQHDGSKLMEKELLDEVTSAGSFSPPLKTFTLATTAPRDVTIQEFARRISDERQKQGRFLVHVFSWDDIVEALRLRMRLVRIHYSEFFIGADEPKRIEDGSYAGTILPSGNVYLECENFFDAIGVRSAVAEELRLELKNLVIELALNAFEHGGARRCDVTLRDDALVVRDDGREFDAIQEAAHRTSGAGLIFFGHFIRKWETEIEIRYVRGGSTNCVTLRPRQAWTSQAYARTCAVILKERYTSGPLLSSHVEFPDGCAEYQFSVPRGVFNASSLVEFLRQLLSKIPHESKVVISFADEDILENTIRSAMSYGWFDPARLAIRPNRADV